VTRSPLRYNVTTHFPNLAQLTNQTISVSIAKTAIEREIKKNVWQYNGNQLLEDK
jgi:hypothetical protein